MQSFRKRLSSWSLLLWAAAGTAGCLITGPVRAQPEQEASEAKESVDLIAVDVLHQFLSGPSTSPASPELMPLPKLYRRLRFQRPEFNPTHGRTQRMVSDQFTASVAVDLGMVSSIHFLEEQPPAFASGGPDRELVKARKAESVKVELDQARTAATNFIAEHVGLDALSGLTLAREGLVDRGAELSYSFLWSNPRDAQGVRWGLQRIVVDVNPTTGGVFFYSRIESPVRGNPEISIEQCREIALRHLVGQGIDPEIEGISYRESRLENGGVLPVWGVRFTNRGQLFASSEGISIHAVTGEVLP